MKWRVEQIDWQRKSRGPWGGEGLFSAVWGEEDDMFPVWGAEYVREGLCHKWPGWKDAWEASVWPRRSVVWQTAIASNKQSSLSEERKTYWFSRLQLPATTLGRQPWRPQAHSVTVTKRNTGILIWFGSSGYIIPPTFGKMVRGKLIKMGQKEQDQHTWSQLRAVKRGGWKQNGVKNDFMLQGAKSVMASFKTESCYIKITKCFIIT